MRFCPFCAKENDDEAPNCAHCGKKLPVKRKTATGQKKPDPPPAAPPAAPAPVETPRAAAAAPPKTLFGIGPLADPKAVPSEPASASPDPAQQRPAAAASPKLEPKPEKLTPSQVSPAATAPTMAVAAAGVVSAPIDDSATIPTPRVDPTPVPAKPAVPVPVPASDTAPTPLAAPPPAGKQAGAPDSLAALVASSPQSARPDVSASSKQVSASQLVSVETAQPVELSDLPPMPTSPPSPGILGAVQYLLPVARAWLARRSAAEKVRTALVGDQRALDQVLGELGRAARAEKLELPALREEMNHLEASETVRTKAERDSLETSDRRAQEIDRFADLETKAQATISEQEEVVRKADEGLREAADNRKREQAEFHRIENEIKNLERKTAAHEARAQSVKPGPEAEAQKAAAESEARAARAQSTELAPQREAAEKRAADAEAPIAGLTQTLADARAELATRKKTLASTIQEKKDALAAIDAELKHLDAEQKSAASDISRRFVTIGTLLNLNRVERPAFSPLFSRIDDLKGGVTEREALIARLEDERQSYDRPAVQKGLMVVGGALLAVVILITVLALILR